MDIGSKIVAKEIANLIIQKQSLGKNCVLGLATGSSPIAVYKELIKMHKIEGLSFEVSPDVPNNYSFEIDCEIIDNLNNTWTSYLSFTAYSPELDVISIMGDLDPGQSADISAVISNVGGTQITYPFVVVQSDCASWFRVVHYFKLSK